MEILVIILSTFLALFLLIGIVLTVLLIKVTLQIRRVTTKAEHAANNLESLTKNISGVASRAFIGKIIMKGVRSVRKQKGGTK